jgi:hypothetical protein
VGRQRLLIHVGVGLFVDVPTLAVAEDHMGGAAILEHRGRDLAGESAALLVAHVLGAKQHRAAVHNRADRLQIDKRRADEQIDLAVARRGVGNGASEGGGASAIEVHLPITGDQRFTHLLFPGLMVLSFSQRR